MYLPPAYRPEQPPKRVVSLVPSISELVYDLGAGSSLAGITRYCVHPAQALLEKPVVGGTKKVVVDRVAAIQPDLILANKEENVKDQIDQLAADYPVWLTDVSTLAENYQLIADLGRLLHREDEANHLNQQIQSAFQTLPRFNPLRTAYLIWKDPYYAVGQGTFIHDMLRQLGLVNVLADKARYPQVSIDELDQLGTELLLLSSEPYPFKEEQLHQLQQALPKTRVVLVDGELFSWYGSRMLHAPLYFRQLLAELSC